MQGILKGREQARGETEMPTHLRRAGLASVLMRRGSPNIIELSELALEGRNRSADAGSPQQ